MPTLNPLKILRHRRDGNTDVLGYVPDSYIVHPAPPEALTVERLVEEHDLTYRGADLYLGLCPHVLTQREHTFHVVSDPSDRSLPLFGQSGTIPRLLNSIKPDEWGVRFFADPEDDPELAMSTAFIGGGKLLAIVTAVGGGLCTGGVLLHNDIIDWDTARSFDSINEDLVHIIGSSLGHF